MSGTTKENDPNQNPGGEGDPGGAGDPNKTVSYETHRKLLSEKKTEQERRQKLEQELEDLRKEKADREKKELEAQGNYKKLLEDREKELEAERKKNQQIVDDLNAARKKRAILNAISGKVPEKAQELLPLGMIELDADGKPTEQSVKAAAQIFEKEYSFAILRDKQGGGLPNDSGKPTKKLTVEQWNALPAKEMKARHDEVDWTTQK